MSFCGIFDASASTVMPVCERPNCSQGTSTVASVRLPRTRRKGCGKSARLIISETLSTYSHKYGNVEMLPAWSLSASLPGGEDVVVCQRKSPFEIKLSPQEREVLESRARKYTLPYFEVLRARMILLAAEGRSNDEIGEALSVGRDVVSLWRKRFFHERVSGLEERPRAGRPGFPRTHRADKGHRL